MQTKLLFLVGTLLVSCLLSLLYGSVAIPFSSFLKWISNQALNETDALIFSSARLPSTCIGLCTGSALAISGSTLQIWSANPLAGPGLLGLNAGSTCALALALVMNPVLDPHYLMFLATSGALLGGIIIVLTAKIIPGGHTPIRLLLIGTTTTAILSSATSCFVVAQGMQNDLLFWMVGGIGVVGWAEAYYLFLALLVALFLLCLIFRDFSTLILSSEQSRSLGVSPLKIKVLLTLLIVVLVGATTAITGPIGFLGFLAPHLGRSFVGPRPAALIPAAAIIGAIILLLADTASRCVTAPNEQPFGIFISFIGAPVLLRVAFQYKYFTTHAAT